MAAGLGSVFQKVLGVVSLRVQQACAFLLLGVVVGNEGELPCWGFKKYIKRQQRGKIFLRLRKIQFYQLPS